MKKKKRNIKFIKHVGKILKKKIKLYCKNNIILKKYVSKTFKLGIKILNKLVEK